MPDHGRGKGGKGLGKGGAKRHRKVKQDCWNFLIHNDPFTQTFPYQKLTGYKKDAIIFVII